MSRDFHLGDILTVTTGYLVAERHMDAVYDLLNFMTGDDLFTHQLPRASNECASALLAQHPDLAAVVVPNTFSGEANVRAWLAEQVERFGETRSVEPLDPSDHTRINPLDEMAMHYPHVEVIPVVPPEDGAA